MYEVVEVASDSQDFETANDHEDNIGVDSQASPPSKRPSPPNNEAVEMANAIKKPLKVVKKEKI